MGVFRPLVKRAQSSGVGRKPATSEKIITMANGMTAYRPIGGANIMYRLITGQKPNMMRTFVTAMTDNEGTGARIWDKLFPKSGRGVTVGGEGADPIADTAMVAEISIGALASPHVSWWGKAAVALVAASEVEKAAWALPANGRYKEITGMQLRMKPSDEGKEAMVEKMFATGFAVWSGDVENPILKTGLGIVALVLGVSGARRGHKEFVNNIRPNGDAMIVEAQETAFLVAPIII